MKLCKQAKARVALAVAAFLLQMAPGFAAQDDRTAHASTLTTGISGLWSHDNLVAWEVAPFSSTMGPEDRAQLLKKLGFRSFAYDWHAKDIPDFDAQIDALEKQGIRQLAWWFPFDGEDPVAQAALEAIRRHHLHVQLWVPNGDFYFLPRSPSEWAKLLPQGFPVPSTAQEFEKLSEADKATIQGVVSRLINNHPNAQFPTTSAERTKRIQRETDRIATLVKWVSPYGCRVALYNHGGWFGIMENELAILERLRDRGITSVGFVYTFAHSRDQFHDDTLGFPALWQKIRAHVVAVNVAGIRWEGRLAYPSQGDSELDIMRTIQNSGWRGPIVISADQHEDAEGTLKNYLAGLDWLAAELTSTGARRPPPFADSSSTEPSAHK